jgi:hypothetical protein|tara:strand:- start:15954 stop:16247 length:294 start_codon:yes stop_codon:yes gene_type:complete
METLRIFPDNNTDAQESEQEAVQLNMDAIRSMVKQMAEIDDSIKDLRDDKKELISDFIDTYNIPKKEVIVAIRMLKGDIDPEITSEIYSNIADLVDI